MVLHNQAVEHNVAVFSELSFAEANTTGNSTIKLLTTAAMVDNLAEKVNECPLNRGR